MDLVGKPDYTQVKLLYIGVATYDMEEYYHNQTVRYSEAGVHVSQLNITCDVPNVDRLNDLFGTADLVMVSGGNTLFAIDRMRQTGLDRYLHDAMARGVVLVGGSAGAICWFDGGHSDSMDPATYKNAMLHPHPHANETAPHASWKYIRSPGLGFLPGLMVPHFDRRESNGLLRADDFFRMMLKHTGESGIAIDHYAGLIIRGDSYRVFAAKGKPGTNLDGHFDRTDKGVPAVWQVNVLGTSSIIQLLPPAVGSLSDLLKPALFVNEDSLLETARKENPDDGIC
ncbi:hypothetical protein SARC_09405 [Sphaeroforma arctica JP610]|uniref:Peptidase E n=1 Tax=Sphaeroforma arctica JP610 TaxID=667725 RepID=A0A0L0FN14_9EUKA|nr:hypothetical protein SARC_09405 [Sphaeroforma arctica JP610]KNC78152.1 hypothetical protein SARC_09405 [Sphaeroforma arctica JP610]|eukprot:XP_014152054.1 hypothetical protein SARC_09405 [Sphaeroforma arctica JP610]